ncbi:PepSY-associated TM helix domain-containing protein [Sphingomonas antarctica]|uniref:PepSY-associated TM helix domain-containing protein n=1 Tax=Sphingomonas antarctica TaxID=2040274 RepID=UPI0039E87654
MFFVPKTWQSATFLRWLKRIHAWTGFWGALFFLMMGTSGFLLNHRTENLKIDTGDAVEQPVVELPVAQGTITDADALGKWAQQTLHLPVKAAKPRGPGGPESEKGKPGGGKSRAEGSASATPAPREARFMGRDVGQAERWTRSFMMPDARVTVDYVPGSNHVTAKREEVNGWGVIKNLHKGVGLPVGWVLFIDTIAGALITMALTGYLLWTRMHGPRLLAGGLAGGALVWALLAAVPSFG